MASDNSDLKLPAKNEPIEEEMKAHPPTGDGHQHEAHNPPPTDKPRSQAQTPQPELVDSFVGTSSFVNLPPKLHAVYRQLRKLDDSDRLRIADQMNKNLNTKVFSLVQYTGGNWYLPHIRDLKEEEKPWSFGIGERSIIFVHAFGSRIELNLLGYVLRLVLAVLFWFTWWSVLPEWLVQRKGYVFDPCIAIFISSLIGGGICRTLRIPPLVGVLAVSIAWANIPHYSYLASGIYKDVRTDISRFGLTVILVRGGMSLDIGLLKQNIVTTVLLGWIPMAVEGVAHALVANKVFHYHDYTWAFLQGMLVSAVSPAVVIPGCLQLQSQGYSTKAGPLPLLLGSVVIDSVSGVWAINFINGIIFNSTPMGLAIALGPIQAVVGIIIGVLLGVILIGILHILFYEAEKLPNGTYSEAHCVGISRMITAFLLFAATALIFYSYRIHLPGGGALASVAMTAMFTHYIKTSPVPHIKDQKMRIGGYMGWLWDTLAMPGLFCMVGTSVSVKQLFNAHFFPRALLCIAVGACCKFITALIVTSRAPITRSERVIACAGWVSKATVQAPLSGLALTSATDHLAKLTDPAAIAHYQATEIVYATNIKNTGVLAILLCAPLGSSLLTLLGPYFFRRDGVDTTAPPNAPK